MRITKKMLEKACKGIPLELANQLANRRWKESYRPFKNGIKQSIKDGLTYKESDLRAHALREQGDAINLSLYIWLAKAVSRIAPDMVDAESLAELEYETRERDWLLG